MGGGIDVCVKLQTHLMLRCYAVKAADRLSCCFAVLQTSVKMSMNVDKSSTNNWQKKASEKRQGLK